MATKTISDDGKTLSVRVPMKLAKRGGRKLVLAPPSGPTEPKRPQAPNNALVKALARAFRWQRMLESGRFGTIAELGEAERTNDSYICRLLRLALLSPSTVNAILDGDRQFELQVLIRARAEFWQQ